MAAHGLATPPWQPLALPGYGGAAPPVQPLRTLDALAQAVLQRLPPQPVDLVGWSLGALVALHVAATVPERVRRLVLLGATARFVAQDTWPWAVGADTLQAFRTELARDAEALRGRFALLCAQGETGPQARTLVRRLRQLPGAAPPVLDDGLAVLAQADVRPLLARVSAPVLLLHGAADALMPLAAAQALAQALPRARLQVLPGAGHALPLTSPQACAQATQAFLCAEPEPGHG